ncbi:MAG: hypothetical protein KA210_06125 [Bacteroidia bacterium]|nr:hypothetical protein [Bacteroidia bacterium]
MNILDKYQISFVQTIILYDPFKGVVSLDNNLSGYLTDHRTPQDVDILIEAIDMILSNQVPFIDHSSESLSTILMTSYTTKFYEDPNYDSNTSYYEIPTVDFREIVVKWREFVSTPTIIV